MTENEVSPPAAPDQAEISDQEAPAFKLSADGQALRAQLDAQHKEHAERKGKQAHPGAKPYGKDAEQPATEPSQGPQGQQDRTTPAPEGEYIVQPETALIPQEHHAEAQQIALDLEAVGQAHGYSAEMMQTALDAGADLFLTTERELTLTTRDQGLSAMSTRYGQEAADRIVSEAHRMTQWLGPDFAQFMDTSGLGNSIATLNVLAAKFRGDLDLTPAKAREKITELRKGNNAMDRDVIDRVKILSRVASPKSKADARSYDSRSVSDRVTSSVGAHQSAKELRAELDALQAKGGPLQSLDGPRRKKSIARRQQIQSQLGDKS